MAIHTIRGERAVLAVLVIFSALAGCSLERSGYQFVRSPSTGTYMKLPTDWKVFDDSLIRSRLEEQGMANESKWVRTAFVTTFAAGQPTEIFPDGLGTLPAGQLRVRRLSATERTQTSLATSREAVINQFDLGVQSGEIQVLSGYDIARPDGTRGERLVYNLYKTEGVYTFDQTVLVDTATSVRYLLFIGCESSCYDRNRKQIEEVVTSLTIKEP